MKIVDLSKKIYSNMPVYPGDPEVMIEKVSDVRADGWEVRRLEMGTHTATHVDAFSHMYPGMASIDQIPLNQFMGLAQRVKAEADSFPAGVGLLFDEVVDMFVFERLLIAKPLFVGGNLSEELERALLAEQIVTYTDLVNLDLLPLNESFLFIGLPLNIVEADGSPVRAVAILDWNK